MSDDSSNMTDVSTIHLDNISLQNRELVDEITMRFLGFDLSTQQLKAIVIDEKLRVRHSVGVEFDKELAEYKTRGGVHKADDGSDAVTAPVNMWLKALDMCLDKLKIDGLDFSSVLAISGCAQQHGSVWWRRESSQLLEDLDPNEYLHKELMSAFSLRDTPIWMDSSTTDECRLLEQHVGGAKRMAEITGSRAYERFTGPQIARVWRHRREAYLVTERITLVSNFLASILSGNYVAFDACDASGMNMMDIRNKCWSEDCLRAVVRAASISGVGTPETEERDLAGLRARLGCSDKLTGEATSTGKANFNARLYNYGQDNIVNSHAVVGRLSHYFVDRYGFPPECLIGSFTGDNPASMAGLCVRPDELILSLGTSDTAFFWLQQPQPGINGHVLRNPLDETKYMGLICFKNGSKTRERIRDVHANGDWIEFERLLNAVPRGNFGNLGFFYDLREIYPLAQGDFRYNKQDQRVEAFAAPELEVRACLEGQFMRLYHHSQALGLQMNSIRRVLVTGGASTNRAILQVIADVFHKPVYTLYSVANSACLGGAYLARFVYETQQRELDRSFSQIDMPDEVEENQAVESAIGDQHDIGDQQKLMLDFSEMVLSSGAGNESDDSSTSGANEDKGADMRLVLAAEPTPIAASDVYEPLLARYIKLETEIALNNAEPT